MSANINRIVSFIKEYGVKNILKTLSYISRILSPILFWFMYSKIFGPKYFGLNVITYFGLMLLIVFAFSFWRYAYRQLYYEENTLLNIERLNEAFERPSNHRLTEEFKKECGQFLKPYIYRNPIGKLVFDEIYSGKDFKLVIFNILMSVFYSYSLFSVIITYSDNILNIIMNFFPRYIYILYIIRDYLPFFMILLMIIQLYDSNFIHYLYSGSDLTSLIILSQIIDEFLIDIAIGPIHLICDVLLYPFKHERKQKMVFFSRFIFPGSLPRVLQATAQFTGNEPLRVGMINYTDETVEGLQNLFSSNEQTGDIPFQLLKLFKLDYLQALDNIRKIKPVVVIGISDTGCEILGKIVYNERYGSRKADFYIRKPDFKKEFIKISEQIEIQKRQLKPLSETLYGMIKKEEMEGNEK